MKFSVKLFSVFAFAAVGLFSGCKNEENVDPAVEPKNGEITVHFENRYGNEILSLNKMLTTTAPDSVEITDLEYFISNVELVQANGTRFKEPNSYHLIQVKNGTTRDEFTVLNVPPGDYTKVLFQVGIDAARNSNHDETIGDLGVNMELEWAWQNSYVFVRNKGFYYDATAANHKLPFTFDIGNDGSLRYVTLPFANAVTINDKHNPEIHLYADVKKMFTSPNVINVKSNPEIAGDVSDEADAKRIADNYATMFSINHIHEL